MAMVRGGSGLGQVAVPVPFVYVPQPEEPFQEAPFWCESQLLSRVFGIFSDACVPQSEEAIYQAGSTQIDEMCQRVAQQGQQTYEECMARAAENEPLYREQYAAAIQSSREREPEAYCEYEASQSHPLLYKLFGGKVVCDVQRGYREGKYTVWIVAAAVGAVLLLRRR